MARPEPIPPRAQWQINDERNHRAMLRGAGILGPEPVRMAHPDPERRIEPEPDEARAITLDEARALPGMLGQIAPAMLARHGEYAYTATADGQPDRRVLLRLDTAEPWDAEADAEEAADAWPRIVRNAAAYRRQRAADINAGSAITGPLGRIAVDALPELADEAGIVPMSPRGWQILGHGSARARGRAAQIATGWREYHAAQR